MVVSSQLQAADMRRTDFFTNCPICGGQDRSTFVEFAEILFGATGEFGKNRTLSL